MIYGFVKWIKEQSFYDDTTIVIAGDHLTMQSGFYPENDYERVTYNAFINARTKPVREKNRVFTAMDMFPTTLAALGAEMDGDRLALGTNLFSDKDTLAEEMGFDAFNDELSKRSIFYNNNLLGKSYYEIRDSN
jgi:phosphoglycerol transferase